MDDAFLEMLIDELPAGLAVLDSETSCVYANRTFRALVGSFSVSDRRGSKALDAALRRILRATDEADSCVQIGQQSFEVSRFPTTDAHGHERVILHLRDVTASRSRLMKMKSLSRTAANIAQAGPLDDVLDRLALEVKVSAEVPICIVVVIDADTDAVVRVGAAGGIPADYADRLEQARRLGAKLISVEAYRSRRMIVAPRWRTKTRRDARWSSIAELLKRDDWDALVSVPLQVRDRVVGVLTVGYPPRGMPGSEDLQFLVAMADQAAVAVETANLFREAERRAMRDERMRLSRELHDSVCQQLFSLHMHARATQTLFSNKSKECSEFLGERLEQLSALSNQAHKEMRLLLTHMRTDHPVERGLVESLSDLGGLVSSTYDIDVVTEFPEGLRLNPGAESDLFFLISETVMNAAKHSGGSRIDVQVRRDSAANDLMLTVVDNGDGFTPGKASDRAHYGLRTMQERVSHLSGVMHIESSARGTTINVRLPESAWSTL